jgi:hypothetical protein
MKRRHTQTEVSLLKRWKKDWEKFASGHRSISRKKHPLQCGLAGCAMCHPYKVNGHEETRQEWQSRLKESEHVVN